MLYLGQRLDAGAREGSKVHKASYKSVVKQV